MKQPAIQYAPDMAKLTACIWRQPAHSEQIVFDKVAFAFRNAPPGPERDALVRMTRELIEESNAPTLLGLRPKRKPRGRLSR